MTPPIVVFATKYKLNLLAGVLVITIVGGFAWWKIYSPNQTLSPLTSTAVKQATPHWAHQSKPFPLHLNTNISGSWGNVLNKQIESWDQARVASVVAIPDNNPLCELTQKTIHLCAFDDANNPVVSFTQTVYNTNTLHIESARIGLNDALLNSDSDYNNPEWRNSILCRQLGIALGATIRYNESSRISSCMNSTVNSQNIDQLQSPDKIDIDDLVELYRHDDAPEFVPITYELQDANIYADSTKWGNLKQSIATGNIEVYELSLGEGFKMVTVAQKK